jgi:hypothetical protein
MRTFNIENYDEILPAHYAWKVVERKGKSGKGKVGRCGLNVLEN